MIVTGEAASHYRREAVELLKRATERDAFKQYCSGLTVGDCGAAMIVEIHAANRLHGIHMESRS
ncbi:MAG: hypothetical protein ACXU8A_05865 [Burkholderiaceae bacterium]